MGRSLTQDAKVVNRRYNSASEEMMPHAIHHHPRGQGIFRVGNFSRQIKPAATRREGLCWRTVQCAQKASSGDLAGFAMVAADEYRLIERRDVGHCGR